MGRRSKYPEEFRHESVQLVLTTDKSMADVVEGRFIDIVLGVRVVQAVEFVSDDPAYGGTMTIRWGLTAVSGGTLVEIVADDVRDGVAAEDHAAGMAWSLEKLAEYLD